MLECLRENVYRQRYAQKTSGYVTGDPVLLIDRFQISLLKLSEFKRIDYILFPWNRNQYLVHLSDCWERPFSDVFKIIINRFFPQWQFKASLPNCANQWTGFYMITASVMKELKLKTELNVFSGRNLQQQLQ